MTTQEKALEACTTRDDLKAWCKENRWRLPRTKDLEKAKQDLREAIYRLEHHGDAFCSPAMLARRNAIRAAEAQA